jgi:hypothetical protein
MRFPMKLKFAISAMFAGAVFAVALIPLVAGTASASTYSHSEIYRCAIYEENDVCFGLEVYTTNTSTQIWKNGSVTCYPQQGNIKFTWCGVGEGNGTGTLNIGVNFDIGGVTGLYERMNIPASGGCTTWGSNSNVDGIQDWYNEVVQCKT